MALTRDPGALTLPVTSIPFGRGHSRCVFHCAEFSVSVQSNLHVRLHQRSAYPLQQLFPSSRTDQAISLGYVEILNICE